MLSKNIVNNTINVIKKNGDRSLYSLKSEYVKNVTINMNNWMIDMLISDHYAKFSPYNVLPIIANPSKNIPNMIRK